MKYYYDCPIVASYMAKYFGVITVDKTGNIIGIGVMQWEARNDAEIDRYYIHPDSKIELDAKVGDVFQHPFTKNCYQLAGNSCLEWFHKTPEAKIIQRNALPFLWPETEE